MPQIDKMDAITKYLLGEVSSEVQDWVEAQMIADEEFLDQCLMIEDRLVDDYVLGHLDLQQRELFETKFLNSPRRRAKFELTQSLVEYANTANTQPVLTKPRETAQPSRQPRVAIWRQLAWAPIAASTLIVIAFGMGLWAIHSHQATLRLQAQLTTAQTQATKLQQSMEEERSQQTRTAEELAQERTLYAELQEQLLKADSASRAIVTLALLPGGFRSEGNQFKDVVIPSKTKLLRLELMIEPGVNYPRYRVALQHSNGEAALTLNDLRLTPQKTAEGQFLIVPLRPLASGDYILTLEGRDATGNYGLVSSYNFHVTGK